jgi:hypothetical protein
MVDAPERDGIGGAGLRAGGREFTVLHLASLRFRLVLRLVDALDAERALLHHTAAADGHIGVELVGKDGDLGRMRLS